MQENYDTLVFWARDSVGANIPSTIKIIGAYAFSLSRLTSIQIQSQVKQICKHAFYYCRNLSRIGFEPFSELQTIGEYAFSHSGLSSILIPSHVTQICEGTFLYCEQLSCVKFELNSELLTIKKCAFSYSNISSILVTFTCYTNL